MLLLKTTVKNNNRRHMELWDEEGITIYSDYVYNHRLEQTLLDWAKKLKNVFLTNDPEVIEIMKANGYDFYDID